MLSASAPIFGNLATATSRAMAGLQRSVGRTLRSGDAVASLRDAGDGGQFSYAVRMEGKTRAKNAMLQGMQNAVSYVQMQAAGMNKLEKTYNRMNQLASLASNSFLNKETRLNLNAEFQSLKQDTFDMRQESFMGNFLYDDMAAKYFPEVDFGKGFTDKTTSDSEVGVGTLSSPPSGWTGVPKYYELEKEVHFNSGKFVLEVNGGGTGERYILKQGSKVIFDTAGNSVDTGNRKDMQWATSGTAYTFDFDRFEIEFAPGQATSFKFVPLTPGNSIYVAGKDDNIGDPTAPRGSQDHNYTLDNPVEGNQITWLNNKDNAVDGSEVWWENDVTYDNKDQYISQLGLGSSDGDETRPWNSGDDRTNHVFSGAVGELQTYQANGQSTKLTLRVEANTIFQINATYSPLEEVTNNITIEGGSTHDVTLESVGIGITLIDASIDSPENAREALGFLSKELESVSDQMATIGANLSELQLATERMGQQVAAGQSGLSRMTDGKMAEAAVQLAKEQMRSESNLSLMTQARGLRKNLYGVLME